MRYACIDQKGNVLSLREFAEKPGDPVGKGWRWLPVEDTPQPDHSGKLETVVSELVVNDGKVVRQWTVERKPIEEQRQAVKNEAMRRILARLPDWKQRNMTARGVELLSINRRNAWMPEEQAEADTLQAAWDWVKAVRSASDVIEAMSPIPSDFRSDEYWPE
jgi:hypothetical protein